MTKTLFWRAGAALGAMLMLAGCDRQGNFSPVDMWNRSRYKPYEETEFYPDHSSSRTSPANTVARGQLKTDEAYYYGTLNGTYIPGFPSQIKVNSEFVQRGQERYQIYCQMCHGETGYGNGMIVKRGFSPPPSYHIARLRTAPNGHFFDVITNGYGAMYSYASRVPVQDRWAIVAYIRALQRSQSGVNDSKGNADLDYNQKRALDTGEAPKGAEPIDQGSHKSDKKPEFGPNGAGGNAENQRPG